MLAQYRKDRSCRAESQSDMNGAAQRSTLPSFILMAASDAVCRPLQTGLAHVLMLGSC